MSMHNLYPQYRWMRLQGEQQHITESYVAVPPALTITDEGGNVWTLGFNTAPRGKSPNGEYAFDVLRNGLPTGDVASRIEKRAGKLRIFTREGWRNFTGMSFV